MTETTHQDINEAAAYCKAMDALGHDVTAWENADGTWTVQSTPFDTEDDEA